MYENVFPLVPNIILGKNLAKFFLQISAWQTGRNGTPSAGRKIGHKKKFEKLKKNFSDSSILKLVENYIPVEHNLNFKL